MQNGIIWNHTQTPTARHLMNLNVALYTECCDFFQRILVFGIHLYSEYGLKYKSYNTSILNNLIRIFFKSMSALLQLLAIATCSLAKYYVTRPTKAKNVQNKSRLRAETWTIVCRVHWPDIADDIDSTGALHDI